jgi:hypothetical protein
MLSMFRVRNNARMLATAACTTLILASSPAWAQDAPSVDPNPGAVTITGSIDFLNQYMFRGLQQNNTGFVTWPAFDLGIAAYSGDGGLKSVGINVGTWNSLHSGNTGSDGPSGKMWYESDFYATLGFGFGKGTSFSTTYTAYNSPNSGFTTVKEFSFKFALDDSGYLGEGAVKPYVLLAQEFGTDIGSGQADAGDNAGTYMEIGIAPGYYGISRASIAFPIKVGFSLNDYYELAGEDNKFGFFSVAGIVTVPLGGTGSFGSWNLHGGVEYQALGTTTEFYNGGESNQVIGSFGIGFSY